MIDKHVFKNKWEDSLSIYIYVYITIDLYLISTTQGSKKKCVLRYDYDNKLG